MIYYFQSITRSESSRYVTSRSQPSVGPNFVNMEANFKPLTLGNICLKVTKAFTGTSVGTVLQA